MGNPPKAEIDHVARLAYTVLGDCLRHTQDIISRFQDLAEGTPLFVGLEALRVEMNAVQSGAGLAAVRHESLKGQT